MYLQNANQSDGLLVTKIVDVFCLPRRQDQEKHVLMAAGEILIKPDQFL